MPQLALPALIAAAQSGESLVSFPTDTVPALACRPAAAGLIYAAKRRSESKPLILMGADAPNLWDYVAGSPAEREYWAEVAAQYWPGALTLVLPASERLPQAMNPSDPTTIGLRIPNHPVAQHILGLTGPLATTSVNRSGEPALLGLDEINRQFPEVCTLSAVELTELEQMLGKPKLGSGQPSTVVKWTNQGWEILRQGAIERL